MHKISALLCFVVVKYQSILLIYYGYVVTGNHNITVNHTLDDVMT